MKLCPSCGAEVSEEQPQCPICEFKFDVPPAVRKVITPPPPEDVKPKLDEVKARITKLTEQDAPGKEEPETSGEEPESEEVEYEEVIEEIVVRKLQKKKDDNVREFAGGKKQTLPSGRKITAEEAKKPGLGRRTKAVIAVMAVIILLSASLMVFMQITKASLPAIGEGFDDWKNSVKYASYFLSNDSGLNYVSSSVQAYDDRLFWYFETQGDLFAPSNRMTCYMLLIDADGNAATGYSMLPGFGADEMIKIKGYGRERQSSQLLVFAGTDRENWNSWNPISTSLPTASLAKKLETSAPSSTIALDVARFMAVSADGESPFSATLPHKLAPGILLVTQTPVVSSSGIIPASDEEIVMSLQLKGFGNNYEITEMRPMVSGSLSGASIGSIKWADDAAMIQGSTVQVPINATTYAVGTRIEAKMVEGSFETDYPSIVIFGQPAIGYVQTKPAGCTIDGCFSDWTSYDIDLDDPAEMSNPHIDIQHFKEETASKAFFFLETDEDIFEGNMVPQLVERILPVPVNNTNRMSGEDLLQIFVDTNANLSVGAPEPYNGSGMRPEYRIEVAGKNGQITSQTLSTWTGSSWSLGASTQIHVAIGGSKIEISVEKSFFNSADNSSICIRMIDWKNESDVASKNPVHISTAASLSATGDLGLQNAPILVKLATRSASEAELQPRRHGI